MRALRPVALFALLPALVACQSSYDTLESRLVEVEFRAERLEARLETISKHSARLQALEAVMTLPKPQERLLTELATQGAALTELRRELDLLKAILAKRDLDAPPKAGLVQIGEAPPWVESSAPPAGSPVEVVAVGSGGLVLVRSGAELLRVELLGLIPPLRQADYEGLPERKIRVSEAWGEASLESDQAYDASQEHLEQLLASGTVRLSYPREGSPRTPSGSIAAYVTVETPDGELAVNATMVRDGFALAAPRHEREQEFSRLENESHEAGRGLFAE